MTLQELQKWIDKSLFREDGYINATKNQDKYFNRNFPVIKSEIISFTNFLSEKCKISQRIWHLTNNIFYIPKCKKCGNETKYIKFSKGYTDYCSKECQLENCWEKSKVTKQERYGDSNYNNPISISKSYWNKTEEEKQQIKRKRERTNKINLGCPNPSFSQEIRERKEANNIQKYGVRHPFQNSQLSERLVGYKNSWHTYTLPSGKQIKLQGYEPFALDELLKVYEECDILHKKSNMPEIWYKLNNNWHRYYPDFFIPKNNLVVEVKSDWTYKKYFNINILKEEATKYLGYKYELIIY